MKVCLVCTYAQGGGAAIACTRLGEALQQTGIEVSLLTATGQSTTLIHQALDETTTGKLLYKSRFMAERLSLVPYIKSKELLFQFSVANTGFNISQHPLVKQADVIHLHWFNQGMLSINDIKHLIATGKPIVWTLHDMWAFTGGCHYNGTCTHYLQVCGNCPYFRFPGPKDLSYQVRKKKEGIFNGGHISYVTCSRWLADEARSSSLLKGEKITSIPNPVDLDLFRPKPIKESREAIGLDMERIYILFGSANVSDKRKGFKYFVEALEHFKQHNPGLAARASVLLVGKDTQNIRELLPLEAVFLGKVNVQGMVDIYNASNLFVIPSLQDNLPNTIVEAMACGTPVAAFANGGIPEMIVHQENGYLAPSKDSKQLAEGIVYTLRQEKSLGEAARQFAVEKYHLSKVAQQYTEVYKKILR